MQVQAVVMILFLLLTAHCLLPTALCYLLTLGRGGGMADATDLKSVDRKVVWVRLPPSAPLLISLFQSFAVHSAFGCVNSVMGLGSRMTLR